MDSYSTTYLGAVARPHQPVKFTLASSQGFYEHQLWIVRSWRRGGGDAAVLPASLSVPPLPPEFFSPSLLLPPHPPQLPVCPRWEHVWSESKGEQPSVGWIYRGKRADLEVIQTGVNLALLRSWARERASLSVWSLISKMGIIIFIGYNSWGWVNDLTDPGAFPLLSNICPSQSVF